VATASASSSTSTSGGLSKVGSTAVTGTLTSSAGAGPSSRTGGVGSTVSATTFLGRVIAGGRLGRNTGGLPVAAGFEGRTGTSSGAAGFSGARGGTGSLTGRGESARSAPPRPGVPFSGLNRSGGTRSEEVFSGAGSRCGRNGEAGRGAGSPLRTGCGAVAGLGDTGLGGVGLVAAGLVGTGWIAVSGSSPVAVGATTSGSESSSSRAAVGRVGEASGRMVGTFPATCRDDSRAGTAAAGGLGASPVSRP
jgi:hypothetical protein